MFILRRQVVLLLLFLLCNFIWVGIYLHQTSGLTMALKLLVLTDCNRHPYSIEDFLVRVNETKLFYQRLPKLSALEWPAIEYAHLPTRQAPLPAAFEPVMSKGQRNLMIKLLDIFVERMIANGMSDKFTLYGATLLGSFRHHDFVPWDDDVDILVDFNVRPMVQDILSKLEPEYKLSKQKYRDKFHTKIYPFNQSEKDLERSRQTSPRSWAWPFLDISYYVENATYVYELTESYGRYYSWPKSVLFPLSYRPFGPKWYPAPHDPLAFLQAIYSPSSECTMFGYSHVLEGYGPTGSVNCHELGFRYPFVEHGTCDELNSSNDSDDDDDDDNKIVWSRESLIIRTNVTDRAVIHSICIPVPKHNVKCETYGMYYR